MTIAQLVAKHGVHQTLIHNWKKQALDGMAGVFSAKTEAPWHGSRQMTRRPRRQGHDVNRKRIRRLMIKMGLVAAYQRPKTTVANPGHNVFIERLWRSLKWECAYMRAFETGSDARAGIGQWIDYNNAVRPHSAHGGGTPNEAYQRQPDDQKMAA